MVIVVRFTAMPFVMLYSSSTRLSFDIRELRELISIHERELDKVGDRETTLLVIIDTDDIFYFVVSNDSIYLFHGKNISAL